MQMLMLIPWEVDNKLKALVWPLMLVLVLVLRMEEQEEVIIPIDQLELVPELVEEEEVAEVEDVKMDAKVDVEEEEVEEEDTISVTIATVQLHQQEVMRKEIML